MDDSTRFHTPIWQGARNEMVSHEKLLRLFRLAMDDLTRTATATREEDNGRAVGTHCEQYGRPFFFLRHDVVFEGCCAR